MDCVHQGIKRSGKSKYVVYLMRLYLLQGRRVATNIDVFLENLRLPASGSRRYDGLLIRLPDSPSPKNLWDLGEGSTGEYTDDRHGSIFLDECSLFLGNRTYAEDEQKKLIEFLVHAGKRRWNVHYIIHDFESLDSKIRNQFISFVYVYKNLKNYVDDTAPIRRFLPVFHSLSKYPFQPSSKLPAKGRLSRKFFRLTWIHKAYSTEQRFLSRFDLFTVCDVNSIVADYSRSSGKFVSPKQFFDDELFVLEGKQYVDMRCNYTVLPPRFFQTVKKNVGSDFMKFILILLIFCLSLYFVFKSFSKEDQEQPEQTLDNSRSKSYQSARCDFFTSAQQDPQLIASFDRDYLIQLIMNYRFKVSNVYNWKGRPRFTIFFMNNKKVIVDSSDSLELSVYGWQTFYWSQGVVLNRGDMWLFLETNLELEGDSSAIPSFLK